LAFVLAMLNTAEAATVVDSKAIANERQGTNWLSYGRTYSESRYSPLHAIRAGNVRELGLAWSVDLPGQRTLAATPLAVDGVLYFSGSNGKPFAIDAGTGRELWEFDPDYAHHSPRQLRANQDVHRGVAFWLGKVYVGLSDGRLVALDASSGQLIWSVQTFDDPSARKNISGAPRVFNGKVIIGHGGADLGTRGYVTAYDANTGKQLWRFYTVPGDPSKGFEDAAMAMAAKTWSGQWWHWGGGGAVWDSITYDPELNRVYLGVGNGEPMSAAIRSPGHGDNLFLSSIVALDADTGKYVWHYQVNPREAWDFDATEQMILADVKIHGQVRKVLMQAPKNGFFYVIDRLSGHLLTAEKYSKVTWARRIDPQTGRPVEVPNSRGEQGPIDIFPGSGAHNWQPMSFNPETGLVYIPTLQNGMRVGPPLNDDAGLKNFENPHRQYFWLGGVYALQAPKVYEASASLLAWDPVAQQKRWEVHYTDSIWNGGTLTTAGNLVFQGTGRGEFLAYNATSGQRLWSFNTGLGITAAPITYEVDGTQYVSVLVGYGANGASVDYGWRYGEQPRRLLTFALGRREQLPATNPPRFTVNAVDDAALVIDTKAAQQGAEIYNSTCSFCHGEFRSAIAPDLRESRIALTWPAFRAVLREGSLAANGMPKYDDLTEDDMRAVYMYVREQARKALHARSQKP